MMIVRHASVLWISRNVDNFWFLFTIPDLPGQEVEGQVAFYESRTWQIIDVINAVEDRFGNAHTIGTSLYRGVVEQRTQPVRDHSHEFNDKGFDFSLSAW